MERFDYLLVGGGMAAHAAAAAIRELDEAGRIGIVGEEPYGPYARPPLSKGLWTGAPRERVWLPPVAGLEVRAGRRAVALDPAGHVVRDDRGEEYRYGKLLLATGARPRRLPLPSGSERVIHVRTLADYDALAAAPGRNVVVIGAGFIGSELASALTQAGRSVTMVFPEPVIGARSYPPALARFVTDEFAARGVTLLSGETVAAIEPRGSQVLVRTASGAELLADAVAAGLGVEPAVELARDAGLAVGDGVEVDEQLRTSAPDVWAAGDVARFLSPALGQRLRVEHEDAALTMGRAAGRAMAGDAAPYHHLPFFYSDLFDLGYEAVGLLDARLDTVECWKTFGREGICYYLRGDRVVGVLLWGTFGKVDGARTLIERRAGVSRPELPSAIA